MKLFLALGALFIALIALADIFGPTPEEIASRKEQERQAWLRSNPERVVTEKYIKTSGGGGGIDAGRLFGSGSGMSGIIIGSGARSQFTLLSGDLICRVSETDYRQANVGETFRCAWSE